MTALRAGAATDTGLVRASNQDHLLVASPLFAVADGMGGHAAGEVASQTAVEALRAAWEGADAHDAAALAEAARAANRQVWEAAQADPDLHGMGTTLVAIALVHGGDGGSGELAVVNVGDSRAYRLRQGELEQLTEDHSLVAELVADGQLAADEAEFHPQRHVLTRALGVDPDVPVDLLTVDPWRGDRLLLCSDGLIREVSDGQVASILRRLADPSEAARELVREARMRGGSDNITVVVVDVVDEADAGAPPPPTPGAAAADRPDGTGTSLGDTTAVPVVAPIAAAPPPLADAPPPEPAGAPGRARQRLVTARVVAFVLVLLLVLAAAAAGIGFYARGSWFVGVAPGGELTVYQGRPGGLLWFQPTVAARTGVQESQVEARHHAELAAGVEEPSVAAARQYVRALVAEEQAAQRAVAP